MKCPYCNDDANFNNSNLSHKYRHSCNKYFKLCPVCNTVYATNNSFDHDNCKKVDNIFDVDYCKECNRSWLPDFPTSWTRSFTNLNKVYEFIQDVYNNEQKSINAENLFTIQRSHFGVIYNKDRAKLRGIEEYIKGSGRRRMLEYLNVLKNMGILRIREINGNEINHELTKLGEEIASSNDPKELLTYFIISFMNIKLNNGYQKDQKNSCYKYFKIRFVYNILKAIEYINNYKEEGASKYQIGLAFLVRDNNQFVDYCLRHIDNYSSNTIKQLFFKDETELNRAVTSTFLNILESMGIIEERESLYYITELGNGILKFLDERPSVWLEDIKKYVDYNEADSNEVFAKLILWRLIKNKLIFSNQIDISIDELNILITDLADEKSQRIRDIHINLNYDEPMYKNSFNYTNNIIDCIKNHFNASEEVTDIDIKEMCSLLDIAWYSDIYSIVDRYEETILTKFVDSTDSIFKTNLQSGKAWHEKTKRLFKQMGFNTIDYKEVSYFESLTIDKLTLMLPGGTIHNPDLLILESGFGPRNCILIDAKDQNSINSELPKLMGYNLYSKNPNVNSYTIIALRGELPRVTKQRIESSLEDFNRITIIEESALEKIITQKMSRKDIINLIISANGFNYITSDKI